MVEMKTKTVLADDPRASRREERARRLKLINSGDRPATIKVYAANETMRRVLRHPHGVRFRAQLDQPVEWPNDSFTARRMRDGSISTSAASGDATEEPDATKNPREQAAASQPKAPAPHEPDKHERHETKPAPKPHATPAA